MSSLSSENVLIKTITVAQDVDAAFHLWTEQIGDWWPTGHSRSGDPQTRVLIEGGVGGRFYERTATGEELEWGRVTAWQPPHRLAHTWYLGSSQDLPTEVDVRFIAVSANQTRIEVEHRGPQQIGELWWQRKDKFSASWESVLAALAAYN